MNTIEDTTVETELTHLLGGLIAEALRYDTDEMARLLKREDLSFQRIGALKIVERVGAASVSDISVCLDLSLANTSILVDKLVGQGFVTRAEDANDRRQKRICLTEKGQALVQEVHATRVNNLVKRMLFLPPNLLERTTDVLREVMAQLPQPSSDETGQLVTRD